MDSDSRPSECKASVYQSQPKKSEKHDLVLSRGLHTAFSSGEGLFHLIEFYSG